MGFKDLIFKSDEKASEPSTPIEDNKEQTIKFPKDEDLFNSTPDTSMFSKSESPRKDVTSCDPHIDMVIQMYEDGFKSLDQEGFDFFEYFQSILKGGIDNPAVYKMAFDMANSMTSISKEKLINQSEFYLSEINKVYKRYVDAGIQKESTLNLHKESEESTLRTEVSDLDKEIGRLKLLLGTKKSQLNTIDGRFQKEADDLNCKKQANEIAKEGLVNKIETVVQGIKNNV